MDNSIKSALATDLKTVVNRDCDSLFTKQKCLYCFIHILGILSGEISGGGSGN